MTPIHNTTTLRELTCLPTGADFGPGPCPNPGLLSSVEVDLTLPPLRTLAEVLTFDPFTRTWDPVLTTNSTPCVVVSWSATSISCTVPPGLDPVVTVRVMVGGSTVVVQGALGFKAPEVTSVTAVGDVGTTGGTVITVSGTEFPVDPWPVAVLVGGRVCTVQPESRTPTAVACSAPRGAGRVQVELYSPLQASNVTGRLSYAPPVVWNITTPLGRPIEGDFPVVIHGAVRVCSFPWLATDIC